MSEEKKIYCTQCGSENAAGSKFCVNCGSKLEELPAQNDTAEAAQEMPEEKNVYAEGLPSEQEPVFEKVTNAEEIKPEPIQGQAQQEDIHITYETPAQTQYYDSSNSQAETVSEKKGNMGIAIASLVCGILSILCCCLTCFSVVLSIAAIVLGIITLVNKYDGKGMAIAGIATGGVGILLVAIFLIAGTSSTYQDLLDAIIY